MSAAIMREFQNRHPAIFAAVALGLKADAVVTAEVALSEAKRKVQMLTLHLECKVTDLLEAQETHAPETHAATNGRTSDYDRKSNFGCH